MSVNTMDSNWEIPRKLTPWLDSFNKIIQSANPSTFSGDTIYITSDYSGELSKSKYAVFSIILSDLEKVAAWEARRRLVREQFLFNSRRMSFKGLNDVHKRNALIPFLDAANFIPGLCVNIVVSKNVNPIASDSLFDLMTGTGKFKHKWNKHTFSKVVNLTHFISILINFVIQANQNLIWYSDEDAIFSNSRSQEDVAFLMSAFSSNYVKLKLGTLAIGTTKLNEEDFFEEDFNSVADLVAGGLSEFFDKVHDITDKNGLTNFAYSFPKNLSAKTDIILDWLAFTKNKLKKVTVVFDRLNEEGGYKIWKFDTQDSPI